MAIMWILLLVLLDGFEGLYGSEHETLCTSNACFTLHMNRSSFEEAQQSCHHGGGYLMTIRDREEEDVVRSLLSQVQGQRQDRALKFWIALKLHRGDCVRADKSLRGFKWVSGNEDSQYANWKKEPVNTCIKDLCASVHYTPAAQNLLKWIAGTCKTPALYVCKFHFKGMCKPLALLGTGEITYKAPFSEEPQRSGMQLFPFGTFAEILCADGQSDYSLCMGTDDVYHWSELGPFCKAEKQNCAVNNGGCKHLCHQEADEVRCVCREGYHLDQDGFNCRIRDLCAVDTCQHECVMGESGYSCKCPEGFKLDSDQRSCSDVDECQLQACGPQLCVNTQGSYMCTCPPGYKMVNGKCSDVDECEQPMCQQACINSIGSFSCRCDAGFTLSEDGRSCVDVDECASGPCPFECVNTQGSFRCTCPPRFHAESDGSTCAPDATEAVPAASSRDPVEDETQENFTESLTGTTVELQHQSPSTDAPLPHTQVNVTLGDRQSNTSLVTSLAKTVNSRVIICVLGSVIPLMLLVAVTMAIAIFRCSRSKKEAKKKSATTDGYCWVSSGLDPRLEKLYESILTDDL